MLDNRLDFINNIEATATHMMTEFRHDFIALDGCIVDLESYYPDISNGNNRAAERTIELARTHLEIALQFTIKALCILGEKKPI
jgi:hypothetical protein